MKLISMTDFVLEYYSDETRDELQVLDLMNNYANFLKQPLTLDMFVTCDEEGNVLEEPFNPIYLEPQPDLGQKEADYICKKWDEYQQAKERVLFDGCTCTFLNGDNKHYLIEDGNGNRFWASWNTSKTIEHLMKYNLKLTKTAIKQIGL